MFFGGLRAARGWGTNSAGSHLAEIVGTRKGQG